MSGSLDRLAARYGIIAEYTDLMGRQRVASEETKRGLLAAMGVPCADEAEIEASLTEVTERHWRRRVPPVVVCDAGAVITVPVAIPHRLSDEIVEWRVDEETGGVHEGRMLLSDAAVAGSDDVDGEAHVRRLVVLPLALPLGYHRMSFRFSDQNQAAVGSLIVTPARCCGPEDVLGDGRAWGVGAQLYGLKSARNWGMGDFTDLAGLVRTTAGHGASFVGLNPLHALFPADPNHFGPYGPSSRVYLNTLYVDVEAVSEFASCAEARRLTEDPDFRTRLEQARDAELVDYPAVAALKRPVLEALYRHFRDTERPGGAERQAAFEAFRAAMAPNLDHQAVFDALHEHFFTNDPMQWSWQTWPAPFRDCMSPEVAAFAASHHDRVTFFAYLQWIADEQLEAAAAAARDGGMAIGLYRDMAVAVHPGGSMAWGSPGVLLRGASIGAPPDDFNLLGQNWGLTGPSPEGLREAAYEPFIAAVRANMRHAGAIRIDHVMVLKRLFWIPDGAPATEGAYIGYPLHDMLRILALESQRNRCLVVGEDLGTLPEGLRPALEQANVLSYRVLFFERDGDGGFLPAAAYPERALAVVSTHDLPTLEGYWRDRDIDWRAELGYWPTPDALAEAHAARDRDRHALVAALRRDGRLDLPEPDGDLAVRGGLADGLMEAVHGFLAESPARLFQVQIEDIVGEVEQANLPGTVAEHPNWRRRIEQPVEALADQPRFGRLSRLLNAVRAEGGG
ncbi:MAG: 4-alpha-glucanotransferase [Rhodospirillaceae bacterium]|nr:4-alpha-glucanotransferase [Rhodospirillaceae bacterium]